IAGDFGGAFGAARLAIMSVHGVDDQFLSQPPIEQVFEPNQSLAHAFDDAHGRYRSAYQALRGIS
ncbi:MAG: xylulokinase, partial [Pseudomonadota bacterium]